MDAVLLVGLTPLIPDFTRPPGPQAAVGLLARVSRVSSGPRGSGSGLWEMVPYRRVALVRVND